MSKTTARGPVALISEQTLWRDLVARTIAGFGEGFEVLPSQDDFGAHRDACVRSRPRLIVLDLDLHGTDPIELARFFRRRVPRARLLVVAAVAAADPVTLNRLAEIGVPGFIDKDQPLEVFEEAVREVAAGRVYRTATLTSNQGRLRADPAAFSKRLTGREQDVLRHVVRGSTSKVIARRLNLSPRSVETFRYRLMRKLDVHNVAGLIEFAFRHGLVPGATRWMPEGRAPRVHEV